MVSMRYDLRKEHDESWTVFDVFTGQPAVYEGHEAIDLDMEYADDLVDLLNAVDLKRRVARGDL
ncbi:hypothetical protein X743_08755 [Mesorhizobium sp. LNHC252B00]|uniref:hypothetical protein n=1 Tax=Mesorhizobium sp. LNHC252B00 TaxID=1287252 RepID=UPI0003CE6066|nr:hypothetical protein [Mesorhizobium sp. LNHC252B00]ESY73717.1 hypothetical protein X743_08755 [Mesorhizobium sp. LNHC252B00]